MSPQMGALTSMGLPGTKRVLAGVQSAKHPLIQKYFDPTKVETALDAVGISLEQELQILADGMRHPDIKIRLKAQAQFRNLMKEIRQSGSIFLTITQTEREGTVERSASASALLDTLERENTGASQEDQTHEFHPPTPSGLRIDPYTQIQRAREAAAHSNPRDDGDPAERDEPGSLPD